MMIEWDGELLFLVVTKPCKTHVMAVFVRVCVRGKQERRLSTLGHQLYFDRLSDKLDPRHRSFIHSG